MIRATDGTFVAGLESIFGHFTGLSLDDRICELLEDIVRLCDLVEKVSPAQVDKAIKHIGGIDMSQAVKALKKGISAMAYKSGLTEGRAIERVESRAGSIIRFLSCRFRTVPKSVKDKVSSITDLNRLDELTDQAAECQSLAEFTKALNG